MSKDITIFIPICSAGAHVRPPPPSSISHDPNLVATSDPHRNVVGNVDRRGQRFGLL